jgi:hypothetical protein
VLNEATGERIPLPRLDTIAFGRLDTFPDNTPANDIVLYHPDPKSLRAISRWHFELRRLHDAYRLRPTSSQATVVDGKAVSQGEEVPVQPGSVVRLSDVLTLRFCAPEDYVSTMGGRTGQFF